MGIFCYNYIEKYIYQCGYQNHIFYRIYVFHRRRVISLNPNYIVQLLGQREFGYILVQRFDAQLPATFNACSYVTF